MRGAGSVLLLGLARGAALLGLLDALGAFLDVDDGAADLASLQLENGLLDVLVGAEDEGERLFLVLLGFLVLDDGAADVDFERGLAGEVGGEELGEVGLDGLGVVEAGDVQGVGGAVLLADLFGLEVRAEFAERVALGAVDQGESGLDGGVGLEGDEGEGRSLGGVLVLVFATTDAAAAAEGNGGDLGAWKALLEEGLEVFLGGGVGEANDEDGVVLGSRSGSSGGHFVFSFFERFFINRFFLEQNTGEEERGV